MRAIVYITLCLTLLLTGCKTHQEQPAGIFHQPNWWERRMDRLDMWNLHHGYPIEKTKETTKIVVGCTLLVAGAAASIVGYFMLDSVLKNQTDPKAPFNDPGWSPGR